jgi:hypothetical protein
MIPTHIVQISLYHVLPVRDMNILFKLIEWKYGKLNPNIEFYGNKASIAFECDNRKWGQIDKNFFDGLKTMGIIKGWEFLVGDTVLGMPMIKGQSR